MDKKIIVKIIAEELADTERRIMSRITDAEGEPQKDAPTRLPPLPENENYTMALKLYKEKINHSKVARALGVSISSAKKYYGWLIRNGYLPAEEAELSDAEKRVVNCIFQRGLSLRETAEELGCSITNVVYRRDSALSKGYKK